MIIIEKDIIWSGSIFTLTNRRALYWKEENTLVLSDLHVGKAAHFRKNGIPISSLIHQQDLWRLELLIIHFNPSRIIFVGDLIHATDNSEVKELKTFIQKHGNIEFILVRGNHDRMTESKLNDIGIDEVCTNFYLRGVQFIHEPAPSAGYPQISGHIHPGVSVRLPANRWHRFPAFVVGVDDLILPAFSHFTGLDTKKNTTGAVFYAFHDEEIFEVSGNVR